MASILKPFSVLSPPAKQVPVGPLAIDWTHPLANGLIACYVPGSNWVQNIAGSGLDLTAGSTAKIGVSQDGPGLLTTDGNSGFLFSNVPTSYTSKSAYSGYYRGYVTSISSQYAPYLRLTTDAGFTELFSMFANADGIQDELALTSGGSTAEIFTAAAPKTGLISEGASALSGANAYTYVNGKLITTQSSIGTLATGASNAQLQIGALSDGTAFYNGVCYIAALWSRQLSHDEMAWLDLEPFCFLIPAEAEMPALSADGASNPTPADCSMLFQSSANLVHPRTLDTNQSLNDTFSGRAGATPSSLGFWFQPPFLGPTPKSTQNTNQPFVFVPPAGAVTPSSFWLEPTPDLQRHVPTIYTAQSFVCNPTIGPPVPGWYTQAPDLLNHPHSLDTNQFRNDIFAGWTNLTTTDFDFWTQAPNLLRHANTVDTNQPFEYFPAPTGTTPADCSFLSQPSALLNHPQTLDANQPKDNFFAGWAQNLTPTSLGFWRQPENLLRHPATLDTNQPFNADFAGRSGATPSTLGFWTQAPNLLRHAVTVDTNQGLDLFVTPAPTVPSNEIIAHWSFAPIGHFAVGQGTLPGSSTPTDCSFLFEPSALLNHPKTLDTNQPKDNFFSGWAQTTPTSLGFWVQPTNLLRHPNTVDTNQSRVSYQDKATPSSLGFWVQPQHLLRHANTVDTNQSLDDAYSGWTILTPAALGFWTQPQDLLRHPRTLDTNQALDDTFAGRAGATPTSFGFWTQAQDLLRHARTIDTNQAFEFNPPAPAQTPSAYWWFQPPDLLRHPATVNTQQSFKYLPPPQPPFGWLVQPQVLLRHPVPFILGGEYSFALAPPRISANAIIKVYFFN